MTLTQQVITVGMVVLGTLVTRFLPFILFPAGRPTPKYIQYLGKVLPAAVFGLLVIYSLKDVSILGGSHGIPERHSRGGAAASVETADAAVHCGRDGLLYAAGAVCILIWRKMENDGQEEIMYCRR